MPPIPHNLSPLPMQRFKMLEYVTRNLETGSTVSHCILYMSGHRLTVVGDGRITCRFSCTRYTDYAPGDHIYPIIFGTWREIDGKEYLQWLNYLGELDRKFFICQRQGGITYGSASSYYIPDDNTVIDASIIGSTMHVSHGGQTFSSTTTPESPAGDYGIPFVCSYNGLLTRFYRYTFHDSEYDMDCVPAYDRHTKLYGMYDTIHRKFYGHELLTRC